MPLYRNASPANICSLFTRILTLKVLEPERRSAVEGARRRFHAIILGVPVHAAPTGLGTAGKDVSVGFDDAAEARLGCLL